MKRKLIWLIVLILTAGVFVGCKITEEGIHIDPNTAAEVEAKTEGAITALQALAVLWAPFGLIGAALAQTLRAWRKAKGDLMVATNALGGVVTAIEDVKENVTAWKALKPLLTENVGSESENVIREIRDLPPIA